MVFSDSPICNLEPVEPVELDVSRVQGINAAHLTSLMSLTFIGDEKLASNPLFPRPPSPAKVVADAESHGKSAELDSECLEHDLVDDMARTLAEDIAADDHNADKKFGAGSQTDSCNGAMTQAGLPSGTAVKSPSNAVLSASNVSRDEQDCDSSVENVCRPASGLYSYSTLCLKKKFPPFNCL